jgi:hypothetical protein
MGELMYSSTILDLGTGEEMSGFLHALVRSTPWKEPTVPIG